MPKTVSTGPGPSWMWLAGPVALLSILLSSVGVTRQMWIDEHVTFYVTQLNGDQFWRLIQNQDLVHGTYYLFMQFWAKLAGTSLIAMRIPSIVGMAVAAGALTMLGRRLFGTRVGLLAGLVFALIPTVTRYGQEVRSYALVSAFVVLATLALTYAIEDPSSRLWTLYTSLMIASVYLHVVSAMVLLPHLLLVVNAWRRERDGESELRWWFACVAAIVGAAAPLLYFAKGQSGQVSWITADAAAVRRYPVELFGSNLVAVVLAVLALAGAVQLARHRAGNMIAVLSWAVVPPVVCYLTFDLLTLFLAKYALFVLPAWALLAGGVLGVPKPESGQAADAPGRRWLGPVAAVFLVLVPLAVAAAGFPAHQDVRRSPVKGEPDFRAAAAVVDAGYRAGDGIVYVGTYRWGLLPFRYELQRAKPRDVFTKVSPEDNGWFYQQDCEDPAPCLGDTPRIWLVVTNYSGDDWNGLPDAQRELLQREFTAAETSKLDSARVVLLVRKKG